MKVKDLKNGMIVEHADCSMSIFQNGKLLDCDFAEKFSISDFEESLRCKCIRLNNGDITHHYRTNKHLANINNIYQFNEKFELILIWQRYGTMDVTMEDIEEKFNCKVRIVESKDEKQ